MQVHPLHSFAALYYRLMNGGDESLTKAAVSPAVSVAVLNTHAAGATRAIAVVAGKISDQPTDLSAQASPVPAEEEDEEKQNQKKNDCTAHHC